MCGTTTVVAVGELSSHQQVDKEWYKPLVVADYTHFLENATPSSSTLVEVSPVATPTMEVEMNIGNEHLLLLKLLQKSIVLSIKQLVAIGNEHLLLLKLLQKSIVLSIKQLVNTLVQDCYR